MKILKASNKSLKIAENILQKGGVIIFPTDTVYGFLADASNKKAVEKIYKIKKRAKSKPLPIFVKDLAMAKTIAVVDKKAQTFLQKPRTTIVLRRQPKVTLYGQKKDSIAMRIPKHQFLQKLLKKPLVQTSVNVSGEKSLNTVGDIVATFWQNKQVELMIDGGDVKNPKPSKIIDFTSKHLTMLR